ncbi:CPBP family intramembrane glutamic endopeptidase [Actinomadura scrupuli]|uniref:CPBP family intramembrane glutamic endopeptidase n=1 Tax=Actinomadura scrupuli TaxID=559629 RepID=UPI003D98DED0
MPGYGIPSPSSDDRLAAPHEIAVTAGAGDGHRAAARGALWCAWARGHPLAAYVIVAYALSWACWIPLVVNGSVVTLGGSVSQFPGLLGPMVAAFVVTAVTEGRGGVRDLASRMVRWRVPVRWWLFAIGTPLLLLASAGVVTAVGSGRFVPSDFGRMAGLPQWGVVFVWAMFIVVNGLGEETGWRGFAVPALRRRHGLLAASLLLVPLWAGWHLPLFLLLQNYRDLGPVGLPGFLIGLSCGSVLLAWLYESASASVLIVAVWHGTYNLTTATAGGHGTTAAIVSTGVMVLAALIAWRHHHTPGDTP